MFIVRFVGGVFGGNIKPTDFLCLILKMLQIQPEKDIVIEFIKNEDFKYVRALGAYYLRLTGTSLDCYKYLEPLLNDYRKIRYRLLKCFFSFPNFRVQKRDGSFELSHMDEFIDQLLHDERVCDVQCPRIQKRHILEEVNDLERRVSLLEGDLMEEASSEEEPEEEKEEEVVEPPKKKERRERSGSREKKRGRSVEREGRERKRGDSRERRREGSVERKRGGRDGSGERKRGGRDGSGDRRRGRDRSEDRRREKRRERSKDRSGESRAERDRREGKGGGGGGFKDECSVEETNKMRAELGLKPLKGV